MREVNGLKNKREQQTQGRAQKPCGPNRETVSSRRSGNTVRSALVPDRLSASSCGRAEKKFLSECVLIPTPTPL